MIMFHFWHQKIHSNIDTMVMAKMNIRETCRHLATVPVKNKEEAGLARVQLPIS